MNKAQLELLMNNLYNCSLAIKKAIEIEDLSEINQLLSKKNEIIRLIEKDKKFLNDEDITLFDIMLRKIQEQELNNIELLKDRKNSLYKKYRQTVKNSKILNKYEPILDNSGFIVDTTE